MVEKGETQKYSSSLLFLLILIIIIILYISSFYLPKSISYMLILLYLILLVFEFIVVLPRVIKRYRVGQNDFLIIFGFSILSILFGLILFETIKNEGLYNIKNLFYGGIVIFSILMIIGLMYKIQKKLNN